MKPKAEKLLEQALSHHQRGEWEPAAKRYRDYLQFEPEDAERWHALGGIEYQRGRVDAAIKAIRHAAQLRPQHASYASDLAGLYLTADKLELAENSYRTLLGSFPDYPPALYNLAEVLYRQQRYAEAIILLTRTVQAQPQWAEAHFNLGVAQSKAGDAGAALLSLQAALRLRPMLPQIHTELGRIYEKLHRYREARTHFEESLRLDPSNSESAIRLGYVLSSEGENNKAILLLTEFLKNTSRNIEVLSALGDLYLTLGDNAAAELRYDEALRQDPLHSGALYGKSRARRFSRDNDAVWIAEMEKIVGGASSPDAERAPAHFALGKIYNDCKEYDRAFQHYSRANALRKQSGPAYSPGGHEQYINQIIATFTAAFVKELEGFASDSDLPVFVLGMPRSGTTLTEQIIASHPQAHGAGELLYFSSISQLMPAWVESGEPYPACVKTMDAARAGKIISEYLSLLRRHSSSATRVVDKNPFNFQHLGLIAALFPKARIIHCRRDPLDVCLSIYFQSFLVGNNHSWDLMDTGHYWLQYQRLMEHWQAILPGRIFDFYYEDLVENQDQKSRELVGHCGLSWDEQCLRFHETQRDVRTASIWQVRQPLYHSSRKRWHHYAKHLEPLMKLLGVRR